MPPALFLARETCDPSDSVCALKHSEFNFVDELLVDELCLGPMDDEHHPGWFDEQRFQKGGLMCPPASPEERGW